MGVRWQAIYNNGLAVGESPGAYANLDRRNLSEFRIYADDYAIAPLLRLPVPEGRRLVFRNRWRIKPDGERALTVLVALESDDRNAVDLYLLTPEEDGTRIDRQSFYGPDVLSAPPELEAHEIIT